MNQKNGSSIITSLLVYMTNFDNKTPSSTKGCLAFKVPKIFVLADNNETKTLSLAEPFVFN